MSKKHAVGAILLWSPVASAFKLSLRYLNPSSCYSTLP